MMMVMKITTELRSAEREQRAWELLSVEVLVRSSLVLLMFLLHLLLLRVLLFLLVLLVL